MWIYEYDSMYYESMWSVYTNYKVLFVETEDPWTKVIWMKL